MKQEWYCEGCATEHFVTMPKHLDAISGLQKINESHVQQSSNCQEFSRIRIRVPACSQREWDRITRRKERAQRDAAATKLFKAAGKWAEISGGTAVVASGPGIIRPGFGDRKLIYQIVIEVMGQAPIAMKDLEPVPGKPLKPEKP